MNGQNAYRNYTEAYKDYAPSDLPIFSFIGDYIVHYEQLKRDLNMKDDDVACKEFFEKVFDNSLET